MDGSDFYKAANSIRLGSLRAPSSRTASLRSGSTSVWRNSGMDVFSKSSHEDDDEEALKWASLEKLPTFDRLRKGLLFGSTGAANEVDIDNLGVEDRKHLLDRLVRVADEDNEKFLLKLRERLDRVGIDMPTIEVKFEHVTVEADVKTGSRALPSFINFHIGLFEGLLSLFHLLPNSKKHITILDDVSGVIKPSRMTLLLGPPSSGKTTLLLALAGTLAKELKNAGKVTYNGHELHEFVPERTSAYISQNDIHIGEMTVRETLAFSARCQGVTAAATEGQEASVVTDYTLKSVHEGRIYQVKLFCEKDYPEKPPTDHFHSRINMTCVNHETGLLVRSNSRRSIPSQADEEAHQLSYLQKHLGNIISLLADSVEGEGEDSLVLSMEKFEHLGFLIYFGEKGSEKTPLSQNAPFFANSDPDMPAAPVPASQVHDWISQNISDALDRISERAAAKENGQTSPSDQDVQMTDVSPNSKASTSAKGPSFIEGISKQSYVKQAPELKGSFVKVVNCHESVIYVLAPLKYATIYGCSDATIVLGAVGKAVRVEHCERVHVISAAKRICIANCRECIFFLGVNQQPLIVGDNHKLQVAPYNTFYPQLEEHMEQVGIEATPNRWGEPVALGMIDPHDSLSHPAGVSDCQAESATHVDPDQFTNFLIPNWLEGQASGSTKDNPFPLPDVYLSCQRRNENNLVEVKQMLREAPLEDSRKKELSNALHVYFKDWLYSSGNIRQLYCLQGE